MTAALIIFNSLEPSATIGDAAERDYRELSGLKGQETKTRSAKEDERTALAAPAAPAAPAFSIPLPPRRIAGHSHRATRPVAG